MAAQKTRGRSGGGVRKSSEAPDASALIDARIVDLADWRGETLARVRAVIRKALPNVVEEWKWRGVPVWSDGGIICTGETYKEVVKLTFMKGAALPDPAGLFNASLEGNARRAIDLREGEKINAAALAALVQAAAELNAGGGSKAPRRTKKAAGAGTKEPSPRGAQRKSASTPAGRVKLLSGGNPQIAKGDGDAPVRAYIEAMPGWKREIGRRLDAIIEREVPGVCKAVKWNSPFYGVEGRGWFLSMHCFAKYVKVAFFKGAELRPVPPGASKSAETRYLDIREEDTLDERQLKDWVRQASALPGWNGK